MNKQEALKRLDEIFDPAIERCKQDLKTSKLQNQKTKKVNKGK